MVFSADRIHHIPADALAVPPGGSLVGNRAYPSVVGVDVPMLEYAAASAVVRLPSWELVRSLYAPNTDLALALVSGPTGVDVGEALCWQPPESMADAAWSPSFERLSDRHYRIRLRDDLALREETALVAAILRLDKVAASVVRDFRLSLAAPRPGPRHPVVRLPVVGDAIVSGHFKRFDDVLVLRELLELNWSPPFDVLAFAGGIPHGKVRTPQTAPDRRWRTTVNELTDRRPARSGARRGHASLKSATRLWSRLRQKIVPAALKDGGGHHETYGRKVPTGAIGPATGRKEAVPSRGFALGDAPAASRRPINNPLDMFSAQAGALEGQLRALATRARWANVAVAAGPRGVFSVATDGARRTRGLAGRAFRSLRVAIEAWNCTLVEIERREGDSAHRHAVIAVRPPMRQAMPSGDMLQRELVRLDGTVPRAGLETTDGLRFSIIAHPSTPADAERYRVELVQALASGILRVWRLDHAEARHDA